MKIKVGDQPEMDVSEISPMLDYLGDDSSPALTNTYQDNVGVDGSIYQYSAFGRNIVTAKFLLHFNDWYDFKLAKHDIYRVFSTKQLIRIRTDAEPTIVKFVRPVTFDINPISDGAHDAPFSIPFENPSGYKYSWKTSDDPKLYETEGWQTGMNLPNGKDLHYQFAKHQMRVYNASDIAVDPYYQRHQLKILMKYQGDSLQLVNKTNGTSWKITKHSDFNNNIVLDGINTTIDSTPASRYTDFGNLVLEPGWNDIIAKGASKLDVTFSFPFIYLG